MSGRIHQIKLDYVAAQDRLLLRVNTTDKSELRFWLTRRFARRFWESLLRAMEADPAAHSQADPAARKAIVAFQHEKAVQAGDFGKPFSEGGTFPLGEDPVVLTGCRITMDAKGTQRLHLQTVDQREVTINLDPQILHSLSRLLIQIVGKTDWDLNLEINAPLGADEHRPAKVH